MDLSGKLLVAMPGMGDPRFGHSVVYMCAHSPEGAMGLIVNKLAQDLSFSDLLKQLSIPLSDESPDVQVHFGGPVEHGRGFVLHSSDYQSDGPSTMQVDGQFGMTATLDVLEEMAAGRGPHNSILTLGYSGWGPGQLEEEIQQNGWLTCDACPSIVFNEKNDEKWMAALQSIGIDPIMLSADAGRA